MTKQAFQQLLGKEPKVAAMNAGLGCDDNGETFQVWLPNLKAAFSL